MWGFSKNKKNMTLQVENKPDEIPAAISVQRVDIDSIKCTIQNLLDKNFRSVPEDRDEILTLMKSLVLTLQDGKASDMKRSVNLSISLNEMAIFAAEMLTEFYGLDERTQMMVAAVEELTASVGEIEHYGSSIAQQAAEASASSKSGAQAVQSATNNMTQISQAVSQSAQQVNLLAEFTEKLA